ncbi:MAG: hypothetical protein ABW164_03625 [Sphingobium sp.]
MVRQNNPALLWVALLTGASVVTTLALGCATPFPSFAALAALHMSRRDGLLLMLASWGASQTVGFCLLGYPKDVTTFGWATALGLAAVASLLGARALRPRFAGAPVWLQLGMAYLAAFLAFKVVVLAFALGLGGVHSAVAPDILARQLVRNAAILIGLYALYRGLRMAGLPPPQSAAA